MIVEQAGFVISLSSDSPVVQGDDEWLENYSMYCAWCEVLWRTRTIWTFCTVPLKSSWASLWISYLYAARKQRHINTHMNIGPGSTHQSVDSQTESTVNRLPYPDAPSLLLRVTLTDLESCLGFLVLVWALVCPVFLWTTSKAAISLFVFLLTILNGWRWQHHSNI